jgi:hypothetical protein
MRCGRTARQSAGKSQPNDFTHTIPQTIATIGRGSRAGHLFFGRVHRLHQFARGSSAMARRSSISIHRAQTSSPSPVGDCEEDHMQKLKFILARDDRAEADNHANQTALSQLDRKANDLGRASDDCSCSIVRFVFHRRYRQNAQVGLRVLKFGGVEWLKGNGLN